MLQLLVSNNVHEELPGRDFDGDRMRLSALLVFCEDLVHNLQ